MRLTGFLLTCVRSVDRALRPLNGSTLRGPERRGTSPGGRVEADRVSQPYSFLQQVTPTETHVFHL